MDEYGIVRRHHGQNYQRVVQKLIQYNKDFMKEFWTLIMSILETKCHDLSFASRDILLVLEWILPYCHTLGHVIIIIYASLHM